MRDRSGVLKPVIVIQLLVVMVLAGVGTAFAVEPGGVVPTATPGSGTPVAGGSLTPTFHSEVYNSEHTQLTGVIVGVHNNGTVAHSGIVSVSIDQGGATITGNESVSNLAAGATTQVTVSLGQLPIGIYLETLVVTVTQTQ